ncbi:hypothetical protein NEOLEDRAFT_1245896 [Neolentinus lepideus HHB14362 ss-1]|uniref:Uncharacterized protein n=1 Tax=Neolentinus lepideus HHB14362 ss-1 TaxID=1314782 RepID=A0A165NAS1_9AGAM|nr:hypothetical protein NEOLEDRAFT_1245896 [Neolentinus lepideus HHB14362 ss-1]
MASPPYSFPNSHPFSHYPYSPQPDSGMKALFESSWRVLEQLPPPSMREILGAYNARGDGDREMLLAMLNAKSAEDQRLAAVATLQRTMLEMYRVSSIACPPPPPENYHFPAPSMPVPPMVASPYMHERRSSRPTAEPSRVTPPHLPGIRDAPPLDSGRARKRARSSRTSHSPQSRQLETASPDLPPSPYSSSHSDVAGRSPRSRGSMAIGSLLSSGAKDALHAEREEESPKRGQHRRSYEPRDEWPSQSTGALTT